MRCASRASPRSFPTGCSRWGPYTPASPRWRSSRRQATPPIYTRRRSARWCWRALPAAGRPKERQNEEICAPEPFAGRGRASRDGLLLEAIRGLGRSVPGVAGAAASAERLNHPHHAAPLGGEGPAAAPGGGPHLHLSRRGPALEPGRARGAAHHEPLLRRLGRGLGAGLGGPVRAAARATRAPGEGDRSPACEAGNEAVNWELHLLELLLGTALRALALGAAMGAALLLFRVRRATVQVCGWMIVLYAAFALPALTWLLPAWQLPWHLEPAAADALALAAPTVLGYGLIAGLLLLRALVGAAAVARLRRSAQPIEDETAWEALRGRARACGLERLPQLAACDRTAVPLTTGVLRPMIVLPATWRDWGEPKLRAVLAHELAHVSRGDALAQQCALVYRAFFWFSPLSWWLCHRLAELAEEAGDEAALAAGAGREDYAELLLQFFVAFARSQRRAHWQALAMAKGGSGAERRVRRILAWRGAVSFRLAESLTLAMALLAMPAVMIAAVVRFSPQAPPAAPVRATARPMLAVPQLPSRPAAVAQAEPVNTEPPAPPAPQAAAGGVELVTGQVLTADTPETRSAALALLARARQNSNLEYAGGVPFQLDATLNAQADASVPGLEVQGGAGQFHEAWSPATGGIWSATMGAAAADRLHSYGRVWSSNGAAPVPMRVQTAHTELLAPMEATPVGDSIRTAQVAWKGAALECILVTRQNLPLPATGRAWQEKEFCVEPQSGA